MWIGEMGTADFRANQYDLFKHNCNNFSECVAQFLGECIQWIKKLTFTLYFK